MKGSYLDEEIFFFKTGRFSLAELFTGCPILLCSVRECQIAILQKARTSFISPIHFSP
jgi:hypothetical protein